MTEEMANQILEKLKNGELGEYLIGRNDFLFFRQVLVKREDFKHFRGIAQRGGDVVYQYSPEARS
jgi:hypothetical protein